MTTSSWWVLYRPDGRPLAIIDAYLAPDTDAAWRRFVAARTIPDYQDRGFYLKCIVGDAKANEIREAIDAGCAEVAA